MFHYTVETDLPLTQAAKSLEAALAEEKFGVLWHLDVRKKLREKRVDFDREFRILEVCNPFEAPKLARANGQLLGSRSYGQ